MRLDEVIRTGVRGRIMRRKQSIDRTTRVRRRRNNFSSFTSLAAGSICGIDDGGMNLRRSVKRALGFHKDSDSVVSRLTLILAH
jgi:hypothetical protein